MPTSVLKPGRRRFCKGLEKCNLVGVGGVKGRVLSFDFEFFFLKAVNCDFCFLFSSDSYRLTAGVW